ncbi:MAG: hypothetical protein Q9M89_01605 [Persephonella sp.]|nr:hypothetical protein [Persephonella sp.]
MNDMDKEDIYIAFHDATGISGRKNKHFHIVLPNVNRAGKSIRLGRDRVSCSELHTKIKGLIESRYTIRKDRDEV